MGGRLNAELTYPPRVPPVGSRVRTVRVRRVSVLVTARGTMLSSRQRAVRTKDGGADRDSLKEDDDDPRTKDHSGRHATLARWLAVL
eukprot:895150-Prymnesium_polylepis.1